MKREAGFTLIELLVVIAIISILAAIVVPNVIGFMARGRMGAAVSEIRGAELAITKMLTDVDKKDMRQFFSPTGLDLYEKMELADQIYVCTGISYRLLRLGRDALIDSPRQTDGTDTYVFWDWTNNDTGNATQVRLREDVLKKVGINYMEELAQDPWDNNYQFWFGPWRNAEIDKDGGGTPSHILFRAYRAGTGDPGAITPYAYDDAAKSAVDQIVPGAPPSDDEKGFPAPTKNVIYIFSKGANLQEDQPFSSNDPDPDNDYAGGGDDINNWDSEAGWSPFYS